MRKSHRFVCCVVVYNFGDCTLKYNYIKPSSLLGENWFYWWCLKHWKVSSGDFAGSDYTFYPFYPWLEEYAKDTSPMIVAMKAAQVGVTEINVARLFGTAYNLPGNLMYVLPTDDLAVTLSRARLMEAVRNSPFLEKELSGYETLRQFKFRNGYIYIRGSQTQIKSGREYQRQLISIDISKLFGDEVDEWNERVFGKLQSRIGASLDPYECYFSTPRLPDGPIEKLYNRSTQKVWSIKCEHCEKWNEGLTLKDNVTNYQYSDLEHDIVCKHCSRSIDRLENDPRRAMWIETNPDTGRYPGYHFTKLPYRAANIDRIIDRFNDPETMQECWNDDLGLPYAPKAFSLDASIIRKTSCPTRDDWYDVKEDCIQNDKWIGVDMGKTIYYNIRTTLKNKDVYFEVGKVETLEELKQVVRMYNIRNGVIDAQPDFRASIAFCEEMEAFGDFKVAYYDTHSRSLRDRFLVKLDTQNDFICHIGRNYAMSQVLHEVISGKIITENDVEYADNGDFIKQMCEPKRLFKYDNLNAQTVMYFPPTRRPDHHFMAAVYSMCCKEITSSGLIILKGAATLN